MNREMWSNPATQRNVAQLKSDGIHVLDVGQGDQACGETGDGRMLEADEILEDLEAFFAHKSLAGRSVLVTAGPTYEAIDPVRGITNLSSGKMGFAIARAARMAGARVTLIAGPVHLPTPRGVQRVDVRSARDMLLGGAGPFTCTRRFRGHCRRGGLASGQLGRSKNQERRLGSDA
jgi:phosphopantothenoylcysteine decarboxylase / phosphopantothenate---cysteine ligase